MGRDGLSIYESSQSIFEQDGNLEYYLDETNLLAARAKADFIDDHLSGRCVLLDVGASYGHFLASVNERHEAYGVEVNRGAVQWSIEHFGVKNSVGSIYDLPEHLPKQFDVITAWDVIEHLEHPVAAIQACRVRLKKGGLLFLSTPDAGSIISRAMGRHWHYIDPVQHINLFSRRNLGRVLAENGFNLRSIKYFGHQYRVRYIMNRLAYLTRDTLAHPMIRGLGMVARPVGRIRVRLKLWDVMGIAAQG